MPLQNRPLTRAFNEWPTKSGWILAQVIPASFLTYVSFPYLLSLG